MEDENTDLNIDLTYDFSYEQLKDLSSEFFELNPHLLKKHNIEENHHVLTDNDLNELQEVTNCRGCHDCEDTFTATIIEILDRRTA